MQDGIDGVVQLGDAHHESVVCVERRQWFDLTSVWSAEHWNIDSISQNPC